MDTAQLKRKYLENISRGDFYRLSCHQMDCHFQWLERSIPMKPLGTVEEPGNLVVFQASGESSYITGHEIMIDVGNTIQEVKG